MILVKGISILLVIGLLLAIHRPIVFKRAAAIVATVGVFGALTNVLGVLLW